MLNTEQIFVFISACESHLATNILQIFLALSSSILSLFFGTSVCILSSSTTVTPTFRLDFALPFPFDVTVCTPETEYGCSYTKCIEIVAICFA